jgi:CBS domain-containing protein
MQAKDIMTTVVATVAPDLKVEDVAKLLLGWNISAAPVVDDQGAVVGIVSEGDLLHRSESETERRRSWWLNLFEGTEERARDYVKSHGRRAEEVMTREVITVSEDMPVGEIAEILEKHRIKRVPVVQDGKLVGIVSRANLLQGLAAHKDRIALESSPDDRTIREAVLARVAEEDWITHGNLNVMVTDGVVELWGWVDSKDERAALKLAVETVPGVAAVEDHLGMVAPYLRGA